MSAGPGLIWQTIQKKVINAHHSVPEPSPTDWIKLLILYRPKIQNLKNCTLWSHKKKKCTNQKAENLNNLVNWSRECFRWKITSVDNPSDKTFHSRMSASRCCWLRKSQGIIKIRKIHPLRTMKVCTRLDHLTLTLLELHWWHAWTNPICLHLNKCKPPHTIALNYYFCHFYLSVCACVCFASRLVMSSDRSRSQTSTTCYNALAVFVSLVIVMIRSLLARPVWAHWSAQAGVEWASKVLAGGGKPQSFSMDINTSAALPSG